MIKTLPEPLDFLCPFQSDLIRIGNSGDGGYLVSAKSIAKASHLLSMGISDDWTFEVEIANYPHKKKSLKKEGEPIELRLFERLNLGQHHYACR